MTTTRRTLLLAVPSPGGDPVLTALVVDAESAARRQVTGLLQLAGWQVHQATSAEQALALDATITPDLVVTEAALPDADGPQLLTRLRRSGSTAHLLVVATEPTDQVRARCTAAGALACLAKPIDARLLLDLVERRTAPSAPAEPVDADDPDDLDDELVDRLRGMYDDVLPTRLTAITSSARRGDSRAVAAAAQALAGTSGQLGHPEVAEICRAIAADARRGILAHHLVADLATTALATSPPATGAPAERVTVGPHRSRPQLVRPVRK